MENKPMRIQRSRKHKQVSPNGLEIKYVGRGSKWGNPFRLVQYKDGKWAIKTDGTELCSKILTKWGHAVYDTREQAAKDAVLCYSWWLLPYSHESASLSEFLLSMVKIESAVNELKGKNLSCWCKANETCHADYLLKIAN